MKILIIGQAPNSDPVPGRALEGRCEEFLAKLAGMTLEQFWRRFEAVNLLPSWPGHAGDKGDRFPMPEARAAAVAMKPSLAGRSVILLGHGVSGAFEHRLEHFTWGALLVAPDRWARAASMPHPSGVNIQWNDFVVRAQAARFLGVAARDQEEIVDA